MKILSVLRMLVVASLVWVNSLPMAHAFCGFYVAKADAALFNQASQVVLVRSGDHTVLSMMNDFRGEPKEFALVVPVPSVLEKGQIHIGERALFDHIDAYSAPRLVEYFDPDPCVPPMDYETFAANVPLANMSAGAINKASSKGVTIEAQYTVGEYDILILSAKESNGLESWLRDNGYQLPTGASAALRPYIEQKMKFFVAKVNLKEQLKTGLTYLRPLQFAFDSPKFMLPIRLGMLNAQVPQDLLLYVLTRKGRVESANYRTLKIPSGQNVPIYVKSEFAPFYKALFDEQVRKEKMKTPFIEYFWNMSNCDPCASEPLNQQELKKLGVFWTEDPTDSNTLLTRLHIRYRPETFPEDLMLVETQDQESFQSRYVLQHPWKGSPNACAKAEAYYRDVAQRQETEAKNLSELTGWEIRQIRNKMGLGATPVSKEEGPSKWWNKLWK